MFRKPGPKRSNQPVNKDWIIQLANLIEISQPIFWLNNAEGDINLAQKDIESKELPVGITVLQNILNNYAKNHADLYTNENTLHEMLDQFRQTISPALLKQDNKFPNACAIYKLIQAPAVAEMRELQQLRPTLLDYEFFSKHLYRAHVKGPKNAREHRKRFDQFVRQLDDCLSDRPRLLLLLDYIVNENATGPYGNNRTALEAYDILWKYVAQFTKEENMSMFMRCCGINSPEELATCIRHECYLACTYTKNTREVIENHFAEDSEITYKKDDIGHYLSIFASNPEIFNQLFKTADDVYKFIEVLKQDRYQFGFAVGRQKYNETYDEYIAGIGLKMVKNPVMMKQLAENPDLRAKIIEAAPIMGEIIKKYVKINVGLGLMSSKKIADPENPLSKLPKEIAQKITGYAAEYMSSPPKKGSGGKK